MRRLVGLLVFLGLPVGVVAQEPKNLSNFSPDFMIVTRLDAATGQVQLRITQYREQAIQQLSVGANVTLKSEQVLGPFRAERFLNLKDCKLVEASGKAVAPADFAKRLKVGAVVVVATDGKPLAQPFVQLLRPDTLILIGPAVQPDPRIRLPDLPDKGDK